MLFPAIYSDLKLGQTNHHHHPGLNSIITDFSLYSLKDNEEGMYQRT